MTCRGVRGATTAPVNTPEAILDATRELLLELTAANRMEVNDIAGIYFTVTPDLNAAFPAAAARSLGWQYAALLDAQAPAVPHDLPRCIRVLILWNTERAPTEVEHVYLREARQLRPDRVRSEP